MQSLLTHVLFIWRAGYCYFSIQPKVMRDEPTVLNWSILINLAVEFKTVLKQTIERGSCNELW